MDKQIDDSFYRIFQLTKEELARYEALKSRKDDRYTEDDEYRNIKVEREIKKVLLLLVWLLPGIYNKAIDLIEHHQLLMKTRNKEIQMRAQNLITKKNREEDVNSRTTIRGISMQAALRKDSSTILGQNAVFVKYSGNWLKNKVSTNSKVKYDKNYDYNFWCVKTNYGNSKKEHFVSLERWQCNCDEYIMSKYKSREMDLEETNTEKANLKRRRLELLLKHTKSGWGQGYEGFVHRATGGSGRVPVCVHLVSVFMFVRGKSVFKWMEEYKANKERLRDPLRRAPRETVTVDLAGEDKSDLDQEYEQTEFMSVSEYVGALYQWQLSRRSVLYDAQPNRPSGAVQ